MSESEAYYRVLPSLHLKESNIACVFVTSGFPTNRSKFVYKVPEKDDPGEDNSAAERMKFSIAGLEGTFKEKLSVPEFYAKRPVELSEMCLAQFAISYVQCSTPKTMDDLQDAIVDNMIMYSTGDPLPRYIKIIMNDTTHVYRLRFHEAVLRIHNFKEDSEIHQQAYSEMLLYYPWRNEEIDLHLISEELCTLKHKSDVVQTVIQLHKKKVFPFQKHVDDIQNSISNDQLTRPSHVFDTLNPEGEMQNAEDLEEGCNLEEQFSFMDCGDDMVDINHGVNQKKPMNAKAQKPAHNLQTLNMPSVYINTAADILKCSRMHSQDQHIVYKEVVKYCKDIIKQKCPLPTPPLIFVHGSAGTKKNY
jgi:hypothetical protein